MPTISRALPSQHHTATLKDKSSLDMVSKLSGTLKKVTEKKFRKASPAVRDATLASLIKGKQELRSALGYASDAQIKRIANGNNSSTTHHNVELGKREISSMKTLLAATDKKITLLLRINGESAAHYSAYMKDAFEPKGRGM